MLVLLPFIIIGPAILFVGGRAMSTKAKERLFYFIDNYSYRIVQIVAFLLAAIMIFDIGVAYQYMGLVKTCVSLVLLFVMYVVFLKTWSLSLRIDPQFDELSAIAHKVKSHMKKDFLVDIHMFQRNKWLRTIPKEKWEEVAYKAYNFVNEITCTYEARDNAIRQLILYMNERTLSLLEECRDQLCLIDNREKIFYQIVKNGMRFDAAREFVEKNEKRRKVNTRRLVLTLKTIFFPLLFIWMLCKAVYALIRDFMLLTKSINKLCPYVVEEKTVSVPERY